MPANIARRESSDLRLGTRLSSGGLLRVREWDDSVSSERGASAAALLRSRLRKNLAHREDSETPDAYDWAEARSCCDCDARWRRARKDMVARNGHHSVGHSACNAAVRSQRLPSPRREKRATCVIIGRRLSACRLSASQEPRVFTIAAPKAVAIGPYTGDLLSIEHLVSGSQEEVNSMTRNSMCERHTYLAFCLVAGVAPISLMRRRPSLLYVFQTMATHSVARCERWEVPQPG